MSRIRDRRAFFIVSILTGLAASGSVFGAESLHDNLSGSTSGTESVTSTRWLAASFMTDSSTSYRLSSVTILLGSSSPGVAKADLHADAGLEPGAQVAALISPADHTAAPSQSVFSADDVQLEANSIYWIVLRAESGSFDWAWTIENSGTGSGFSTIWVASGEAGASWHVHDVYPIQLKVMVETGSTITDCNHNGIADEIDIASGTVADSNANGIPDTCEATFLRGDSNCDGAIDISDAVRTLIHLFAGGAKPCCGDGADVNDDGKVDISDPVSALSYLFQGGAAPPAPGPILPCGIDLTSDDIDTSLPCEYPESICAAGG